MLDQPVELVEWLRTIQQSQPLADSLLRKPAAEQQEQGYFHTLREICQQPLTWFSTADLVVAHRDQLAAALHGAKNIILTGSGSSEYIGECVRLPLQSDLNVPTSVIGGGVLVSQGTRSVPPGRPALMVSLARSGDSPESTGAVSLFLNSDNAIRHLVLTCNGEGKLATLPTSPRVSVLALDDRTNDRSLVMTSSFTNLVLAARALGYLNRMDDYAHLCRALSKIAERILLREFGKIAVVAQAGFRRVVFLGSGSRFGAARESALKMLESSAGRVATMSETYLGLRHGPMSFVHQDTLIVCFLSCDSSLRGFECDLLAELDQKGLGVSKVVVGERIPSEILRKGDLAIECPGLAEVGDSNAPVIDVLVSQVLAFFRCRLEGLHPDAPSNGVINRVVQTFQMHFPATAP